jgi:hypothetical protein
LLVRNYSASDTRNGQALPPAGGNTGADLSRKKRLAASDAQRSVPPPDATAAKQKAEINQLPPVVHVDVEDVADEQPSYDGPTDYSDRAPKRSSFTEFPRDARRISDAWFVVAHGRIIPAHEKPRRGGRFGMEFAR